MATFDYSNMPAIVQLSPSEPKSSYVAEQQNPTQGSGQSNISDAINFLDQDPSTNVGGMPSQAKQAPLPAEYQPPPLPLSAGYQPLHSAIPPPPEFAGTTAGNFIQHEINEWLSSAPDTALGMFETYEEAKQAVAQGPKYLAMMSRHGGIIDNYYRLPPFDSETHEMISIYVAELCLTNPQLGYDPQSGAAEAAWNQKHP